jgi:tRNA A37 threonylcarbamoyladenosine biosynthesis protein TsaE
MNQALALNILKSGQNVFLTGSAGAGKTHVLNQYIKYLKARKVPVAVTASTGIAATHMNGMTIHSWSGIGIKNNITRSGLLLLETKKYLKKNLDKVKVLIIDEISMLHKNQLELVNIVLKHFKNSAEAFGGIQVVLSGDFFQLPPIGNELPKEKFAFMAPAWVEAGFTICYLTVQYRQSDNELNQILNEIRRGNLSEYSRKRLTDAQDTTLEKDWNPTKLYTHNVDVDHINSVHLAELEGRSKRFDATTKGNQKILESFKKSVQASEHIVLKKGAKVMFVRNNPEAGYINGSMGEIIGYSDEGFPVVRLLNGRKIIANEENWTVENETGRALATYIQVPLRLAWAITVHKSQGMTLDAAEINLSKTFEKGQGYVALSRLKELKNLKLLGFNETALQVDRLALRADRRFLELAAEAEVKFVDVPALEKQALNFIKSCGGITKPDEIKKHAKKQKHKSTKKSTYLISKELVENKLSLKEIVEERGFTRGTIISHLVKLKTDYPDLDISRYKPAAKDLKLIKTAFIKASKNKKDDEPVKLNVVFKQLKQKFSYEELRLARLFIDDENYS